MHLFVLFWGGTQSACSPIENHDCAPVRNGSNEHPEPYQLISGQSLSMKKEVNAFIF